MFFRASIIERAREMGVTGWVRNRFDGSVEVLAEGPAEALDGLNAYCGQGPPGAIVRDLKASEETETGEFEGFSSRSEA